jgi:hypothetical protein
MPQIKRSKSKIESSLDKIPEPNLYIDNLPADKQVKPMQGILIYKKAH